MARLEQLPNLENVQTSIELASRRYRQAELAGEAARRDLVELYSSLVGQRIKVQALTTRYMDTDTGQIHDMPTSDDINNPKHVIEHQWLEVVQVLDDGVVMRVDNEANCPVADIETIDFVPPAAILRNYIVESLSIKPYNLDKVNKRWIVDEDKNCN